MEELNKAMEKWVSEIAKKRSVSDILKKIPGENNKKSGRNSFSFTVILP